MSSNYSVLCTSHDPAVEARVELRTPADAEAAIAAGIQGHETCDLVIARYSGALIELACPPTLEDRRRDRHRCYPHRDSQWVRAEWMRLLHLALQEPPGTDLRAAAEGHSFQCWPRQRVERLRLVLGFEADPPKCALCKGRGVVPDWQNWDHYHGEPKPKPCPVCGAGGQP